MTKGCHGFPPGGKSAPQDEVDEIEVYGSEAQSGTQLATYSFEVATGGQGWTWGHPRDTPVTLLFVLLPQVCDSILNIGPCANAAMGEPAFLSEEVRLARPSMSQYGQGWGDTGATPHFSLSQFQNSPEPDLEIVLCSGYGKNGALSVLQVRPPPSQYPPVPLPVPPPHCAKARLGAERPWRVRYRCQSRAWAQPGWPQSGGRCL